MKFPATRNVLLHVALLAIAAICLLPFAWVICASLKQPEDIFDFVLLPSDLHRVSLENFAILFRAAPFWNWMINSLFITSTQTISVVLLSSLSGYALAKLQPRGGKMLLSILLASLLLPSQVLLPSTYELIWKFGWLNSYAALLVPGAVSVLGVFLFYQAMQNVPDELIDAARIDGCGELRIWWQICLPIVRPTTGAFTLISFLASWNGYLWPQVVLQDDAKFTLPMGLASLSAQPQFQSQYGVLMAGTLLSILPVIILFFFLQRDFIDGIGAGAVKG